MYPKFIVINGLRQTMPHDACWFYMLCFFVFFLFRCERQRNTVQQRRNPIKNWSHIHKWCATCGVSDCSLFCLKIRFFLKKKECSIFERFKKNVYKISILNISEWYSRWIWMHSQQTSSWKRILMIWHFCRTRAIQSMRMQRIRSIREPNKPNRTNNFHTFHDLSNSFQ